MSNKNELMRRLLSRITNSELQDLIRVREETRRPIPAIRGGEARRPIPKPRRNVQKLVQYFEANPIPQ